MSFALFEAQHSHIHLLPLTHTRPVGELRVGINLIREKWEFWLGSFEGYFTQEYLSPKYSKPQISSFKWLINSSVLPSESIVEQIRKLKPGEGIFDEDLFIGGCYPSSTKGDPVTLDLTRVRVEGDVTVINRPWDIFRLNGQEIRSDIKHLKCSGKIEDPHTVVYGSNIFVEEGAKVRAAIINTETGPVYIGRNTEIHEGAMIKGPFALCEGSHVNMGAKIKGDTTVGPYSKVGGEVSNVVIQGYSNKGHDGFLGNAVLGEWCNLGADTNNSNLKNTYANVRMWDYESTRFIDSGLQFCGLIMGDHSKAGINTMFNTGTVIGVSANVFGEGFPRNFIPSFAWGGNGGFSTFKMDKVFETAQMVMQRRNQELTDLDKKILTHIFNETAQFRHWEK
jgi:UDP-N-acetylglucosamine diphosphorylase/glucosamine-1-phosphate N-acetyltransferase